MQIKTRLHLSSIISICLIAILVFVVVLSSSKIAEESRKYQLAHHIHLAVSQLDIITYEYLMHREKRMEQQWHSIYASTAGILAVAKGEIEEKLVELVYADYNALGDLFPQVTANYDETQELIQEEATQEKIDVAVRLEKRLVAQLLIRSQSIITNASRLDEKSMADLVKTQELAKNLILFLTLVLVVTGVTTTLLVTRIISKSLAKLEKGAEIIGKGNFEYRIDMKRKDEMGRLATTFNRMTKDLKIVTASRDELNREITQRKRAEEEKEKLQAQLLQAQKMESIGILTGGIAHNFNNILTAIQGYADLALMQVEETNPLYRDLKQISTSVFRAADLTKQLLAFSRKQPINLTSLNLSQTIKNLIKMLSSLIGEDITIETDLEPHLWTTKADEFQIEQVMMNLVTNAKDAMPKGGKLFIRTENLHLDEEYTKRYPEARPGRFIRLSLQDDGVGMDKETISHIFEPFFTTKGMAVSTGLGLPVIHGIVKQHQGWINVYSEPKKGSLFTIYLPASPGKEKEEPEERASLKMLQGRGEKILLVEDEEAVRTYLTRALSENGYQVREAKDARQALRVFAEEKKDFQLIFADVILPDKDALQLAKELLSQKPDLCLLFSSGYTDLKSQASLIKRQGFPYLPKPYSLVDLLRMVRTVLEPH